MRRTVPAALLVALLICLPATIRAEFKKHKDHDFLPKVHNVIFIMDVSDSMQFRYDQEYVHNRQFVAAKGMQLFNLVMPHVPHWQYDVNSALITFGDDDKPKILDPLSPWSRKKYSPYYPYLRVEEFNPTATAGLPEALQLAGQLACGTMGRTAIVIFTDGGNMGVCPQKTAAAMKKKLGDNIIIYGVWVGDTQVGWRNLYETCKLTGGYCRHWDEVKFKEKMQEFAWDITVREIMFPYTEIFFRQHSAELLPSEALKLENVANFLHAIPQYVLQIDGHTDFFGDTGENYRIANQRAANVKKTLVKIFKVDPRRIQTRSWGEELPRYDNRNPETRLRNRQANLYLKLPLRGFPYDEKNLHTFGVKAVGNIYNTQERNRDEEWAWPDRPPEGARRPMNPIK